MKWYKKLYLGENAEKSRYKVFGRIRMNKFSFNTYLIVLPSNKENLLDIISVNMKYIPIQDHLISVDICILEIGEHNASYIAFNY